MKLLTFRTKQGNHLGVKTERGVIDVTEMLPKVSDVKTIINNDQLLKLIGLAGKEGTFKFLGEEELDIAPCVTNPEKIVCVGLNYRKHAEESNAQIPESPILFNKYNNALAGHNETIELPSDSKQVDYEVELGIVIGKETKEVSKENALNYVFGYCNANDLSARDLQFRTNQWLLGKSLDGFCPLGPYLVTADEVEHPNKLDISCSVNGEIRQQSNTEDLIFKCDEIVSYVSHYMTLKPGDVILTGTPEGVIMGYEKPEQEWLKNGDKVAVEVEGLGKLVNVMK